ncbi:MAG: GNAT family N-acetyltransferase [Anaerolineae bacterium]|nr:GNAT family N-acetyltransferase [Anaerolineae bacterium]
MITRRYHPDDAAAVLALIDQAAKADRTRRLNYTAFVGTWAAYSDPTQPISYDEAALVANETGALQGFAWWTVAGTSSNYRLQVEGWVHPESRRSGVGTALLRAVDDYVHTRLRGKTTIFARVLADVPGAEQLFRNNGYQLSRQFYIMRVPLQNRTWTAEILDGITFKTFRAGDLEPLVEADNAIFADHWGSRERNLSTWRHEMIETRPHDPHLWTLAWADDNIVGECLCHASNQGDPNDGWVSIVGVRRDYRGKGLGRALLAASLNKLRDFGFDTGSLSVDAENTAAVNLYRGLGMNVIRTRLHFTKSFEL